MGRYNNLKFFDFEVFPEWWCCVVSDEEHDYPGKLYKNEFDDETEQKIKSKMRIYTSDMPNVREQLVADMKHGVLSGYNIKRYDMIILKCIAFGFTPRKLYIASDLIIHPENANIDFEHQRVASFIKFGWGEAEAYQDLMDDSGKNDKNLNEGGKSSGGNSLKDKECSLGIDIRETTVPFGKVDLTQTEKDDIIFYCKHDVYALHVFYWTCSKAYIDTKLDLCDTFDLTHKVGYTNTNANLAGKVLKAERVHGTTIVDPTITIRDPQLKAYFEKWLPAEIYNHLLTAQENKKFKIYENEIAIGDGGLHSVYDLPEKDAALYVESTDEWTMYNVDASSCYPSVMIFCQAMSRAIREPERLIQIYRRRLNLKLTPKSQWSEADKAFVPAAKLVLNTTYGAMGNKWLTLYDDYMRSKVCRVGQMILIALGNELYNSIDGLKIIQNNTDGVLVYARRSDEDKIMAIVKNLQDITKFTFEVEEDSKLWQLNVNNYVAVHPDGEVKNKGGAFVDTIFQKGTNRLRPLGNFAIQKAQMKFYTEKANPIQELLNNKNVEDFCLTCTKGPTYKCMRQYNKNGTIDLGKVSRVIAVTDENLGLVKKVKVINGVESYGTIPQCPEHPLVVDDNLRHYAIAGGKIKNKITGDIYTIDYKYYVTLLSDALDVEWYSMINEKFEKTEMWNL